jgi:hypothetical protein
MEAVEGDFMQTDDCDDNYDDSDEHQQTSSNPSFAFQLSTQPASLNHNGSLFATSDPFFLAVSERQAAANSRRRLEAKPFAVSAPLQVTPNPIQVGTLNRDQSLPFYASQVPVQGNNHAQLDATLLQYR